MDVSPPRYYVAPAMSFLLVFSAVFNALTGAFVGVRPAEPVPQQLASSEVAAVAKAVAPRAIAAPAVVPVVVEAPAPADTPAPVAVAPLETDRLLE